MKVSVAFLCVIYFALCDQVIGKKIIMADLKEYSLSCIKKIGINRQMIDDIDKLKIIPMDNKKYHHYLSCFYKKQGYQTEDGHILYEKIRTFLTEFYEPKDLKFIDICKENAETSREEENAVVALDCILSHLKKVEMDENYVKLSSDEKIDSEDSAINEIE